MSLSLLYHTFFLVQGFGGGIFSHLLTLPGKLPRIGQALNLIWYRAGMSEKLLYLPAGRQGGNLILSLNYKNTMNIARTALE